MNRSDLFSLVAIFYALKANQEKTCHCDSVSEKSTKIEIDGQSIVVSNYATMRGLAHGVNTKTFLVKQDEKKGQRNTMYRYVPGIGIMWVAAILEN